MRCDEEVRPVVPADGSGSRRTRTGVTSNYPEPIRERYLMAILLPILIVVLALDVFCFVDLYRAEEVNNLPKWAWVLLIIVLHFFGSIGYLIFGRKRNAGLGLT
jgi:hypothetical protein